ncbi:MAG: hypothetical protein ACREBU_11270 [Nitrososphaera sp.]
MNSPEPRYFILVDDAETGKYSLKNNLWGFSEQVRGYWEASRPGDNLAFYVTLPTKKIVGFGKIKRKFIDSKVTFPDEIFLGRPIWIYIYEYLKTFTVEEWNNGIRPPPGRLLNAGRKLIDRTTFYKLTTKAKRKWKLWFLDKF